MKGLRVCTAVPSSVRTSHDQALTKNIYVYVIPSVRCTQLLVTHNALAKISHTRERETQILPTPMPVICVLSQPTRS